MPAPTYAELEEKSKEFKKALKDHLESTHNPNTKTDHASFCQEVDNILAQAQSHIRNS